MDQNCSRTADRILSSGEFLGHAGVWNWALAPPMMWLRAAVARLTRPEPATGWTDRTHRTAIQVGLHMEPYPGLEFEAGQHVKHLASPGLREASLTKGDG
jgi:hypothetical protein